MTDQSNHQEPEIANVETPHSTIVTSPSLELEYPHILLQASLDSLLTCSYQSASSGSTARMASSVDRNPSLDESWASLDIDDFSHDEEAPSESTDNASLLDITSTEDEEDGHSDAALGDNFEQTSVQDTSEPKDFKNLQRSIPSADDHFPANDTIVLVADHGSDSKEIHLAYRQKVGFSAEKDPHTDDYDIFYETIRMTVSHSMLDSSSRPFHVAYYGTPSAKVTQSEVLGKVGGALVASGSSESSSTYHIAPSEFDAELKPRSVELVPSDAQMFVEDITVLKSHTEDSDPDNIDIAFKHGTVLRSRWSRSPGSQLNTIWRPDLLVIGLTSDDTEEDIREFEKVLELTTRHQIPSITIADGSLSGRVPTTDINCLHQAFECKNSNGVTKHFDMAPIDLESFIRLDSEQLNQHIKFLIEQSHEKALLTEKSLTSGSGFLEKLGLSGSIPPHQIKANWIQEKITVARDTYQENEALEKESTQAVRIPQLLMHALQTGLPDVPWAKSLLIGLIFMFFISFFQPHSQIKTIDAGSTAICGSLGAASNASPIQHVATSSSVSNSKVVSSATNSDLVESNIFAYFLGSHSAERSVGDVIVTKEPESSLSGKEAKQSPTPEAVPILSKVQSTLEKVRQDVQEKLIQAQEKLKDEKFRSQTQIWDKHRDSIEKLQEEVRRTFDFVSANAKTLSKRSRKRFFEIMEANQVLLARSREATEAQLSDIVKEQKNILAAAQKHARKLLRKGHKPKKGHAGRRH